LRGGRERHLIHLEVCVTGNAYRAAGPRTALGHVGFRMAVGFPGSMVVVDGDVSQHAEDIKRVVMWPADEQLCCAERLTQESVRERPARGERRGSAGGINVT
jgi:hypothetical protein